MCVLVIKNIWKKTISFFLVCVLHLILSVAKFLRIYIRKYKKTEVVYS